MKLPVEWLRTFVNTPLSDEALADKLTMAGLEVEEITPSEDGPIYHTKVTPNRGDWMSLLGVGREAAAALDLPLEWKPEVVSAQSDDINKWASVLVADKSLSPRYAGKVIRNVTIGQSPAWMQKRLNAAGMRPLNVIVDITNYVMLELGQPLHAFDFDTLPEGKVIVRTANAGETIITLDGVERALTPHMLMICDRDAPVCIAGVMGSAETEVTPQTKNIFLESAHFDAGSVRRTSKALGLTTEASYRFERFVDPEIVPIALERAAGLMAELGGGEVVAGRIDQYSHPITPTVITLRPARTNAILGTDLDTQTIAHALCRLGLTVEDANGAYKITVPTFRPDLVKEIDLIEEVGRMVGYETLPETLPRAPGSAAVDAPQGAFATRIRTILVGHGLQEALTHSLAAPSAFDDPHQSETRVAIRQALSAELSGLRQNLVPNLLDALARNLRQKLPDVRLFEVGKVFSRGSSPGHYLEDRHLAAALTGAAEPHEWNQQVTRPIDFFYAKGLVESLFAEIHIGNVGFVSGEIHHMHPGRCAIIQVNGETLGFVAEVDPDAVKQNLDIPSSVGRVCVFELNADKLMSLTSDVRKYTPLPRFPSVTRDLAVVVDLATPYGLLENTGRAAVDAGLLEGISLQSIYTGERVSAGQKSVALRFSFRAAERTLTDAEVEALMADIEMRLVEKAGATRR